MPSLHDKIWEREATFTPITTTLDFANIELPLNMGHFNCAGEYVSGPGVYASIGTHTLPDSAYEPVTPTVIVETRNG